MGENATRAALASAFIYPGAGLFLLKHYVRGCIFAIPATLIVLAIFSNLFTTAIALSNEIAGRMISTELITMLWREIHNALYSSVYWQDGKWILIASWLLSIISSYFAGKKLDIAANATKAAQQQ